jgi:hypothetical protein
MSNRILSVELRDRSVVPAEAEVLVTVVPEVLDSGTGARGRLMGPRCHFASTVEVAYHLRPLLVPTGRPALTLRAIIPEASLWEPETPHIYAGPVELWQDGARCEVAEVRHGLRHISLGPRGLRLNGRLLRLRGREVERLDDGEALALRKEGYNLLVAPVRDGSRSVWEVADRIGFLVLGRLRADSPEALLCGLAGHPSCMGWLLPEGVPAPAEVPYGTLLSVEQEAAGGAFVVTPSAGHANQEGCRPALVRASAAEADALLRSGEVLVGVLVEG